mmetsp:Transcript_55076/g.128226  ORF Transcript_55076/g.128226 Transcript_55076/m.128226 type:complete len:204 (-) Transcript_55076:92-703(-)
MAPLMRPGGRNHFQSPSLLAVLASCEIRKAARTGAQVRSSVTELKVCSSVTAVEAASLLPATLRATLRGDSSSTPYGADSGAVDVMHGALRDQQWPSNRKGSRNAESTSATSKQMRLTRAHTNARTQLGQSAPPSPCVRKRSESRKNWKPRARKRSMLPCKISSVCKRPGRSGTCSSMMLPSQTAPSMTREWNSGSGMSQSSL